MVWPRRSWISRIFVVIRYIWRLLSFVAWSHKEWCLGFCTNFLPLLSLPFVPYCMSGTVLSPRDTQMAFKESGPSSWGLDNETVHTTCELPFTSRTAETQEFLLSFRRHLLNYISNIGYKITRRSWLSTACSVVGTGEFWKFSLMWKTEAHTMFWTRAWSGVNSRNVSLPLLLRRRKNIPSWGNYSLNTGRSRWFCSRWQQISIET